MTETPSFQPRPYDAARDESAVAAMWEAHRTDAIFCPQTLSPCGCVVELQPGGMLLGALWLYPSPPLGFLENAVTQKGLTLGHARAVLETAEAYLRDWGKSLGLLGLVCNVAPGIARFLKHYEFRSKPVLTGFSVIPHLWDN